MSLGAATSAVVREDRRGHILSVLRAQGDYALNDLAIRDVLDKLGHRVSTDVVKADLGWLEELGAVRLEEYGERKIAKLTSRGEDIITGRAIVPGIQRPRPSP